VTPGVETRTDRVVGLSVRSISKTFDGVRVVRDVSADFAAGRITALVGQNGSGKSTLIKVLAGFHAPDPGGSLAVRGVDLPLPVDPATVHRHGLRFVHQNLALVKEMSAADNIAFAQGFPNSSPVSPISRRRHRERAREMLARLGVDVDPDSPIGELAATDRTLVAIARAFDPGDAGVENVVVLDEPTAYLPASAVDRVLSLLLTIREQGGTIIYVTHRLDEVLRVADDLVVLRDGALVANRPLGDLGTSDLAELIVGEAVRRAEDGASVARAEVLLETRSLSGPRIERVSFELHEGEILGVAGLIGCGRSELARLVAGVQARADGEMLLGGEHYEPRGPRAALSMGVGYVPADRHHAGIIGDLSLRANMTLGDLRPYWSRGKLHPAAERNDVQRLIDRFDIRPRNSEQPLSKFSGGNQQKAVLAKIFRLSPRVLVIDEPTQGVDVGGKAEIIGLLRSFAADGGGVLLASSDFDEIGSLCDRVLVLDRGRPLGIFARGELDERRLALLAAENMEYRT